MIRSKPTDVILHAFDWPYSQVTEHAQAISDAGYKAVLVSPPMKSYRQDKGTPWWQRYQPQDYRVIDNQLGNTESFQTMVSTLQQFDLWVYADVVFNHMANESSIRLDLQYPSEKEQLIYRQRANYYQKQRLFGDLSQPLFTEDDFVEAFGIQDWQDKWQVQNGRISGGPHDSGLPTLRANAHVIEQQQAYLLALKAIGVKGFRIDAAKHMSIEHLKKVWSEALTHDVHIFGEIITDGGATKAEYQLFLEPYLAETRLGAYDFPLFQTVYNALQPKGSLKSLIDPYCFGEALSKERAITFAITHDIPNNDVFMDLVMSAENEALAYSYIFGRDGGVPLIYSDLNPSDIRDSEGRPRWQEAWCAPNMLAGIAFHNQMHGLPMKTLEASDDLLVFSRGDKGMVIMNKSSRAQQVDLVWTETLYDLYSGDAFPSSQGKVTIHTPSKSSRLLSIFSGA
ncbi:alpha-amylase family protein [Vibrio cincinnatiensis]|uniref:Alpha-amylase n=1 Tax=Vibrio cincinnatiensis DSM 19608 TaxID=1123491 RepID=A0A1T4Q3H1_VIBCI|nr:alpha-amylase family protein [Vibrio cincinnatiensis]MCG3721060.1 alpha-amylase [Vibrio cincinnatiensis]SJZ98077.1 alpha-amylase [Vibrio cincinnatiensis DSM 19608]SUP05160.1 glycosidase [Vibrio cincinnatiensis]